MSVVRSESSSPVAYSVAPGATGSFETSTMVCSPARPAVMRESQT